MNKWLYVILWLFSCDNKSEKNGAETLVDKTRDRLDTVRLVSFRSEFVSQDGSKMDAFYEDRSSFIEPYTSSIYKNDTLYVTTLHEVNCCGKTVGMIKFYNDSLFLLVQSIEDEACTCVEFKRYHYIIVAKDLKRYKVIY